MNIINENNEKSKRYLPHELQTRINAVKTYRMETQLVMYVENTTSLEFLYIVEINIMMVQKNL